MANPNYYGGLIFTNHALQRLRERQFPQSMVVETFQHPDKYYQAKQPGAYEYLKRFGKQTVTIIVKQNDRQEWLVLSCWIDPPFPGTKDYYEQARYRSYQQGGFWKKMWITLLKQLGL